MLAYLPHPINVKLRTTRFSQNFVVLSRLFTPGSSRAGLVVDKVALGHVFLAVLCFPLSVSFHRGSPYSCIVCGMNNRPVGGPVDTYVSPTDKNKKKMTVVWDAAPCSLVENDRRFRGVYCLHHQNDDGGSKHIWNVGKCLSDYTAHHPKRQSSSKFIYIYIYILLHVWGSLGSITLALLQQWDNTTLLRFLSYATILDGLSAIGG
jgi:hypothetical protein